jgi:ABC-type dipeptide/oligopeptide/nickel transport system permease subunit
VTGQAERPGQAGQEGPAGQRVTGRTAAALAPRHSRGGVLVARFLLAARRDPLGCIAAIAALLLVLLALLAPLLPITAPAAIVGTAQQAPSAHHLLGTDQLGRDVLIRTIFGARHTLVAAVLSTALAAAIGTPLGILAGYLTRWPSGVVMRVMDVLLAFPGLLLALVVVPSPDGGANLSAGVQYLGQAWWISAAPGIAITITILVANYLGDFLASMTDPDRLRQPRTKLKDTTTLIAGEG